MKKVKGASQLANISGMNGLETTKAIQSITNQFKLMENANANAGDVTSHVGDVLTAVSKNMKYDFAGGIKELNEAISTSGSVAEMSGVSLESYAATVGALIQQTGKSGNEIANAYKMISARVLQIKSVAEDAGVSDEDMSKAQKALDRLGISIEDTTTGSLRNLDDILKDVGAKWGNMTDVEKQYTSEMLAGNRQRSVFTGLMESMIVQQGLYNNALESTGALEEANNIKAQSIEGKMNTLKTTVNEMWSNMINSDAIKGGIETLTSLVEVFGNLPAVIGLATTALLLFKGKALMGVVTAMIDVEMTMGATSATTALFSGAVNGASASLKGLGATMMANPLGLFAVALTGIVLLMNGIETTSQKLEGSINKLKDAQSKLSEMKSASDLVSQYKELEDKIGSGTLTTEQMTTAKKDLLTIQENLAKTFPDLISGFDKEGNAIATNLDKINKKIAELSKTAKLEMESSYNTAYDAINSENIGDKWYNKLGIRDMAYARHDTTDIMLESISMDGNKDNFTAIEQYNYFLKLKEKNITLTQSEQDEYKRVVEILDQYNSYVSLIYSLGGDISNKQWFNKDTGTLENAQEYYKAIKDGADDSTKKNAELNAKIKEQQELIDIKKQTTKYSDALSQQQKIADLQNEINEAGSLTPSIIQSALGLYPEMGAKVFDVASLQEYLNEKIGEQEDIQREAFFNMTKNDDDYFKNSIKNTSEWETFLGTVMDNISGENAQYYSGIADNMKTDLQNSKNLAEAKLRIEQATIKALATLWSKYYQASYTSLDGTKFKGQRFTSNGRGGYYIPEKDKAEMAQYEAEKKRILQAQLAMENALKNINSNIDLPTFTSTNFKNSGKGSGSSSTEKEVEDIKDLIDIYYDLQNAMDVLSARQTYLKTTREGTFGKEYQANLQQELVLLEKQQQAVANMSNGIKNERWDLIRDLGSNWGFTFGSQGEVTNYKTRLKELMNYANSLTGETKENFKSALEEVSDKLQNYTDLTINQTNDMSNQWQEYNNQIKETYKLMADAQVDAEGKISETYKHILQERLDTTKKYIDEIKNKLNTQWNEDEYADQKQVAQQTLLDIRSQINNAVKSGDKELIADLQKQYTEQQKTVNDMIRDHEREQITDKLDKEESKLDEQLAEMLKPENLNQTIQTALQEGYFKIGDEIVNIQSAMTDMVKSTTEGFMTSRLALDDYLKSLSTGIEMTKQLGNINNGLGLVSSVNNVPQIPASAYASINNNANSKTLQINSPLIHVDKVDSSNMAQMESMVDTKFNNLIKIINDDRTL